MPYLQLVPLCLSDSISSRVPAIKNNFNSSASGCFQNPNIGHASIRSTSTWTDLTLIMLLNLGVAKHRYLGNVLFFHFLKSSLVI